MGGKEKHGKRETSGGKDGTIPKKLKPVWEIVGPFLAVFGPPPAQGWPETDSPTHPYQNGRILSLWGPVSWRCSVSESSTQTKARYEKGDPIRKKTDTPKTIFDYGMVRGVLKTTPDKLG